ncbi:hypothetical protein CANCADRAFT_3303 [Tortispora caseinolytica NRRL Y-17796]|uniref:Mob1/phocein n=1 Tax=Tortispora caseinolytica NRRL Y-17796 TaxID=767744 RepID=A0A1E4TA50_9ASCO|nr:hypothetical protein CANCADRAFT_3303 [Tortispora caseinolytica NRRL Y-17796]
MSFFHGLSSGKNTQTLRSRRAHEGASTQYQLRQYAEATLGADSLKKIVQLPEGEDLCEWLAVNTVDFYNQINMLYGVVTEFCSPKTCPVMKATDAYEYLWQDPEKFRRPVSVSAPEYIELLMAWVQSNFDNEQIFPARIGVPFPKNFVPLIKTTFKRLFRVYAHIYCHHLEIMTELGLESLLNTSFKHYVLFAQEFELIDKKDYGPLASLVANMLE